VTLLVVTLLMAVMMPQMTTSFDERRFMGDEARVVRYHRVALLLNTFTISCSVAAFILAWDLVYQAYEVPTSKAFVLWVLHSQGVYLVMVSPAELALITELAGTYVITVRHRARVGVWTCVGRKHWRSVRFMDTAFSGVDLKERALYVLQQMHAEERRLAAKEMPALPPITNCFDGGHRCGGARAAARGG